jgi:transitional endoplasmic reticulum ATPase
MNSKKLRVKDAGKDDAGRGIVRIDPDIIEELTLKTGDVIEIYYPTSEKKTAALLYPGRTEDKLTGHIRLDASLRRNLGCAFDDHVEIRKINTSIAEKVTFAGLEEATILRTPQQLAKKLEHRVITEEDVLSFYSMGRRVDLIVVNFKPKADAVRIQLDTKIILSEKSHKELTDLEKQGVTYEDIGGLKEQKNFIRDIIELPLNQPKLYKRLGINPPRGIIFYGPSGTGKTLLAKAIVKENEVHSINISGSDIMSRYLGQAEENLRNFFKEAEDNRPSIIVIDEIDSIAPRILSEIEAPERRIVSTLISLMDGIRHKSGMYVIGTTHRINDIESSLRTSGRFGIEIEFSIPNEEERLEILIIKTRKVPLHEDVDLEIIAKKTKNVTGADLEALVTVAAMLSIREYIPELDLKYKIPSETIDLIKIKMEHFIPALLQKHKLFIICPKCKTEYRKDASINYCQNCGEKLVKKEK